jgi:hypothetical protein
VPTPLRSVARPRRLPSGVALLIPLVVLVACAGNDPASSGGGAGQAGSVGAGGSADVATGGVATGGLATGGVATAGTSSGAGTTSSGSGLGGGAGGGGTAAAGSAGTSGGGGAAAGMGSTCSTNYLLCEDFESTPAGMVPMGWTAHGKASVAEDQANHGKRSLKIMPADNGERRIYHATTMVGAAHWGRVYYRVQLPTPDAFVHSTLVTFLGKGPTVEFRFVDTVKDAKTGGFADGKYQFLYNVQPNGAEFGTGGNYDYTFDDKWHCTEWHVDAADQSYQFFYDGKQVLTFTHGAGVYKDSELPTTFAEVRLGWNNYQSAPPGFTAWLDDFVIDDLRVGCLP